MRVIYSVGAKFAGGGIGDTAYQAARGLHEHGMLFRLLCGSHRSNEIPANLIRSLGVVSRILRKAATYEPKGYLYYLHYLLYDHWNTKYLEPCDVFHSWSLYSSHSLLRAKALGATTVLERASTHTAYQAKLLQEEYARWGLPFRVFRPLLDRAMVEYLKTDYVLIPSEFVRRSFQAQGFPERKLLQIPFGVDATRFKPAGAGIRRRPFRLLFIGQVGLRKGVLYLLEAWQQLHWRDAELWIAGQIRPEVRPFLGAYHHLPGLRFNGFSPDPGSLYQQADVFVFPSIEEGSALVTYEALASGLPVITTPNAGSIVRDGVDGYLVPIRDVEALASRMEQLRSDERLRLQMGQAARQHALNFTWDAYRQKLIETINVITAQR